MRSKKVEPFDLIRINRLKILVYKSDYHLIFIKPLLIDVLTEHSIFGKLFNTFQFRTINSKTVSVEFVRFKKNGAN